MRCAQFLEEQIEDAKKQGVLFSLHMKATMMKVSDPKIFGHAVTVYYKDVFEKHGETLKKLGVDPDNGLGDLYTKIKALPDDQRKAIEADIQAVYKKRPPMAMVNSDKGITNLHVPSDIIIDASMPPVIRDSGKMWGPDGKRRMPSVSFPMPATRRSIKKSLSSVRSTVPWIQDDSMPKSSHGPGRGSTNACEPCARAAHDSAPPRPERSEPRPCRRTGRLPRALIGCITRPLNMAMVFDIRCARPASRWDASCPRALQRGEAFFALVPMEEQEERAERARGRHVSSFRLTG